MRLSDPDDPKLLDKKAFGEAMGISAQSLSGYITNLKKGAKTAELKALGYSERQLPAWVPLETVDQQAKREQESTPSATSTPSVPSTPTIPSTPSVPSEVKPEQAPIEEQQGEGARYGRYAR